MAGENHIKFNPSILKRSGAGIQLHSLIPHCRQSRVVQWTSQAISQGWEPFPSQEHVGIYNIICGLYEMRQDGL